MASDGKELRPIADLSSTGLLWLINRTALHPHGFALGISEDGSGWTLLGDGSEPYAFTDEDDKAKFATVMDFLARQREA